MVVEREKVVPVIRDFAEALRGQSQGRVQAYYRADPEAIHDAMLALVLACRRHGVEPEDYIAALKADPSLAELEKLSMIEAIVEAPDPGPYDAISRESPSGQPGDLSKPRTLPRREAPGGA